MAAVPSDWFLDAVAFTRAVLTHDEGGAETIVQAHSDPLEILTPQAYLLGAVISRLSQLENLPESVVWAKILETIDKAAT